MKECSSLTGQEANLCMRILAKSFVVCNKTVLFFDNVADLVLFVEKA